jgi:hypothetical protein
MGHRAILTFIFVSGTHLLFGQISLAFHLNDAIDLKNRKVTGIIEELKIGSRTIKYVKIFNGRNQVISDERHDQDDRFVAKFSYAYDSLRNLKLSETREFVDKSGSHTLSIEKYGYSKKGILTKITYLSEDGRVTRVALVSNNKKDHPVKLEIFDSSGVLTGSETANYDYKANKASYEQRDAQGTVIYSGFFIIDYNKQRHLAIPGFAYDGKGFLIKTPDKFSEVVYDQHENWTSVKTFREVDGKDELIEEQSRVLKYSE